MDERLLYAITQLSQPLTLLGGLSPYEFMRNYWQKKPLLIRQALPNASHILNIQTLFKLAKRDDVESRLISQFSSDWRLKQGPFKKLPNIQHHNWTLLVQGVNDYDEKVKQLLQLFSFIPDTRLDDVMVSYATPGGGVGPHFDSYDVFLLQIQGKRKWQISMQPDLELIPDLSLKILKNFRPQQTWILEVGDMLYLPPHIAHHGVAIDACLTASIGFRSPSYAELAEAFFGQLTDSLFDEPAFIERYSDPQQLAVSCPGKIPTKMAQCVTRRLRKMHWQSTQVEQFLGCYLSEPKSNVFFDPPDKMPTRLRFHKILSKTKIILENRSKALYDKTHFYLNGERVTLNLSPCTEDLLPKLANYKVWFECDCDQLRNDPILLEKVYIWLSYGWLILKR